MSGVARHSQALEAIGLDTNERSRCEVERLQQAGLSRGAAFATIEEHDRHAIEDYGWTAHHIVGDTVPSAHTHGLSERFGHPDLQVVLPAAPETIQRLLAPLAQAVVNGRTFRAGEESFGVFNVPVRFVERQEGGRPVLRAIYPDPKGKWPDEHGVQPGYDLQLLNLE